MADTIVDDPTIATCAKPDGDDRRNDRMASLLRDGLHLHLLALCESLALTGNDTDRSLLTLLARHYDSLDRAPLPVMPAPAHLGPQATPASRAHLFLLLAECGAEGRLTVHFPALTTVYLGHAGLSVEGPVTFTSEGDRCVVDAGTTRTFERRGDGHWAGEGASGDAFWRSGPFHVHLANTVMATSPIDELGGNVPVRCPPGEAWRALNEALGLIDRCYPEASPWLATVLRQLVFVEGGDMPMHGSSPAMPGTMFFAWGMPADVLATGLMHECSHQYFNLLHRVCPLVFPGFQGQSFSPFKGENRPDHLVLLALHAAANMHRLALRHGDADTHSSHYRGTCAPLAANIAQMHLDLLASPGLTRAGHRFLQDTVADLVAAPFETGSRHAVGVPS